MQRHQKLSKRGVPEDKESEHAPLVEFTHLFTYVRASGTEEYVLERRRCRQTLGGNNVVTCGHTSRPRPKEARV